MFEWLEREISAIKTPRFHLVDGPADARLRQAVNACSLPVPASYREFVLNFGNARLYRIARNSYLIGVFAAPKSAVLDDGTQIYHVGFHDGASVYFKELNNLEDRPIFEFEDGSEEKVADTFAQWLTASCASIRGKYTRKQWNDIINGPKPFTAEEAEIIEARRSIHWEILGIDAEGNHIFEVVNQGSCILQALTVGVRSKDERLNGAIRLKIGHIGPGQRDFIRVGCYQEFVSPRNIEIFSLPDPQPEDRAFYWEFRTD